MKNVRPAILLRALASAALLSFIAGCASSFEEVNTLPTETLLVMTDSGAGPIGVDTPYSKAAIEAALPGYTVDTVTMASETRTETALAAFHNGLQVLQVLSGRGGKIGAIHGVTHHMTGPNGERIGMTFAEVRQDINQCRVGTGNWRGMPICTARGTSNVTLIFAIPGYEASDALPDANTVATSTLQRIIWTPPQSES
ncbi:RpoE-regulated lipoprotein [Hartmannibacter diazotrophicus]|uniref:RpoE-regulated lipoprotein n=1 Tax=Hartmannibacter diazotrophicus TaxID=1482074 RepID=A0A2C9D3I8_9HYPH|nr:DUF1131 family protein [Hartmannibacter diazotrophicus]SON54830.1 RpoE-regulated lipoprotein [Hartmannibacter diazotrophicus]